MFTKPRVLGLVLALAFVFVLAGLAQQATTQQKTEKLKNEEMVVCAVCGSQLNKAMNPISWDYKGQTYYFCSQACKDAFMKDPESFIQKGSSAPVARRSLMRPQGLMAPRGRMMQHGPGMAGWWVMWRDVDFKVEDTENGAALIYTSQDPETVKMIQDHADWMKQAWQHRQEMMGQTSGAQGMAPGWGWEGAEMRGGWMMGNWWMMWSDVDLSVENTKDGATLTYTSQDAKTVKMIKDHAAWMQQAWSRRGTMMGRGAAARPMRHGLFSGRAFQRPEMRGGWMMGGWWMMWQKVDLKVEDLKDGASLTFTSQDPQVAKMIKDHADWMKQMWLHRQEMMTSPAAEKKTEKEPAKK
jgi:YHS domain-containing protein